MSKNNSHSMQVPPDFGNITNISDLNPYQPWLAQKLIGYDQFNEPVYEDIGTFETFSESLLALITINSINKNVKNKLKCEQKEKEYINYTIDKFIKKVEKKTYIEQDTEYVEKERKYGGPLIVRFRGINDIDEKSSERTINQIIGNSAPPSIYHYQPGVSNQAFQSIGGTGLMNPMSNYYNPALNYDNPAFNWTFKETYIHWRAWKSTQDISPHTMCNYDNIYKKVSHLNNKRFLDIRYREIIACVDKEKELGNSFSMRKRVKLFFSQLYQYMIMQEVCQNNPALNIKLGRNESNFKRKPFSLEQIAVLFEHVHENPFIETVLMLIFNGCRIREFLNIKREDCHLDDRYFIVTESKTKSGRNRIVPISRRVIKFYRKRLRAKSDYLIHDARGRQMEYGEYSAKFKNLMRRFGWSGFSCHNCRTTCATLLHSAEADSLTIKRILGHSTTDITERHYISSLLPDFHRAIDKI